jgi:lysophospholipase L1-like esterase
MTNLRIPLDVLADSVDGAVELEWLDNGFSPRRLPAWTRARQPDVGIQRFAGMTAGVNLRLRTAARFLELDFLFARAGDSSTGRPRQTVQLAAEVGGVVVDRHDFDAGILYLDYPDGSTTEIDGAPSRVEFALGGDGTTERDVSIWLPHTSETIVRGGSADATVTAATPRGGPRWVHHGSSISHCLEAEGPLGPWPHQAARALGISVTNLGFAGNALLDPFVAQSIAALPADVITVKLGINVINLDGMRTRIFGPAAHGFLDFIRHGHPETPLVVISSITSPYFERTPGPSIERTPGHYGGTPRQEQPGDGTLTIARTRDILERVVAARADDPNLYYLDGRSLLGPSDAERLYDDLHPDQAGYDLIARRFVDLTKDPASALGRAFDRQVSGSVPASY